MDLDSILTAASGAASPSEAIRGVVRTLQSSSSIYSGGCMVLAADPHVGSFGASCDGPHQIALGRVAVFSLRLPERRFQLRTRRMRERSDWTKGAIPSWLYRCRGSPCHIPSVFLFIYLPPPYPPWSLPWPISVHGAPDIYIYFNINRLVGAS